MRDLLFGLLTEPAMMGANPLQYRDCGVGRAKKKKKEGFLQRDKKWTTLKPKMAGFCYLIDWPRRQGQSCWLPVDDDVGRFCM